MIRIWFCLVRISLVIIGFHSLKFLTFWINNISVWLGGVETKSGEGRIRRRSPEEARFWRRMEGSRTENRYDRYLDCSSMVYL